MGFLGNTIKGRFQNQNNGQNQMLGRAAPNGWNNRSMFGAANPLQAFSMFGQNRQQMQQPEMPQQGGRGRQWMGSPYSMLNGMNGMWRR
jgi:hypothetical protein